MRSSERTTKVRGFYFCFLPLVSPFSALNAISFFLSSEFGFLMACFRPTSLLFSSKHLAFEMRLCWVSSLCSSLLTFFHFASRRTQHHSLSRRTRRFAHI